MTVTQHAKDEPSIGELVKDASTHFSTVLHGEIELAKIELKSSFKNVGVGVVFFAVAAVLLLMAFPIFLIFGAEGLHALYFSRWLSYLIVFGVMVVLAVLSAFLGLKKVKRAKAPERTIATTKSTVAALKQSASNS